MKRIFTILTFFALHTFNVFSQGLEVGIFTGATSFNGDVDVTYKTFLPQIGFGIGGLIKYNFSDNYVLRAQFNTGTFGGDEKKYPTSDSRAVRGYSFTSKISDVTAVMEWHPFGLTSHFQITNSEMFISFYGFTGIGATFFDPTTNFNQPPDALNTHNTEYSKKALVIPIGGGVRWHLSDNFTLNAEISSRKVFSDYADGLKTKLNGARYNDYYFFSGISLTYLFMSNNNNTTNDNLLYKLSNTSVSCPRFK